MQVHLRLLVSPNEEDRQTFVRRINKQMSCFSFLLPKYFIRIRSIRTTMTTRIEYNYKQNLRNIYCKRRKSLAIGIEITSRIKVNNNNNNKEKRMTRLIQFDVVLHNHIEILCTLTFIV